MRAPLTLLVAALSLVAVLGACGDEDDDPSTVGTEGSDTTAADAAPDDAAALLDAAEVLADVHLELSAEGTGTFRVTVRNDRDTGVGVLDPSPGHRATVERDDAVTELYLRPAADDSSASGDEPVRYPGTAIAAGEVLELDRRVGTEAQGRVTVCIEAKAFSTAGTTGEDSDLPERDAGAPLTLVCSEPTEVG